MRIIGGKFRGKKIFFDNTQITRPLRDFVRENIFNLIFHGKNNNIDFEKSKILDLYSGFGSFGLECLSRNAKSVVFVEKDKNAFKFIKKNLNNLKINKNSPVINDKDKNKLPKKNIKKDLFPIAIFSSLKISFKVIFPLHFDRDFISSLVLYDE